MTLTVRRVERAEKRFAGGGCSLCDARPKTYEVVWITDDEADEAEEYCPQCGRKTSLTVGWNDWEVQR